MKRIYLGLLFLAFAPCFAMNQPDKAQEKMYTIQDSDGRVVELPESVIKKISVFYNSDEYYDDSDFKYHDFSFKDTGLNISGEQLKTLSTCLQNPKKIKNLNAIKLNELFEVADCLGVDHSFLRRLTKFAQKHFPNHKHHELIQSNHFSNSIKSLYSTDFFAHDNEQKFLFRCRVRDTQEDVCFLDLSHKKLDTLQGIERIAPLLADKKVVGMFLMGNCLKIADLTNIFTLFPNLKKIDLSNNELVKVHFPSKMPAEIRIILDNNPLEYMSGKLGEENIVSIKNNTISKDLQHCLDSIVKPSFYNAHRHQIKSLYSKKSIKKFRKECLVGGSILASISIISAVTTGYYASKDEISTYFFNFFKNDNLPHNILGMIGTCVGVGLVHGSIKYCWYNYLHGFPKHQALDGFKPARIIKDD
jgi:hypothetical protein